MYHRVLRLCACLAEFKNAPKGTKKTKKSGLKPLVRLVREFLQHFSNSKE